MSTLFTLAPLPSDAADDPPYGLQSASATSFYSAHSRVFEPSESAGTRVTVKEEEEDVDFGRTTRTPSPADSVDSALTAVDGYGGQVYRPRSTLASSQTSTSRESERESYDRAFSKLMQRIDMYIMNLRDRPDSYVFQKDMERLVEQAKKCSFTFETMAVNINYLVSQGKYDIANRHLLTLKAQVSKGKEGKAWTNLRRHGEGGSVVKSGKQKAIEPDAFIYKYQLPLILKERKEQGNLWFYVQGKELVAGTRQYELLLWYTLEEDGLGGLLGEPQQVQLPEEGMFDFKFITGRMYLDAEESSPPQWRHNPDQNFSNFGLQDRIRIRVYLSHLRQLHPDLPADRVSWGSSIPLWDIQNFQVLPAHSLRESTAVRLHEYSPSTEVSIQAYPNTIDKKFPRECSTVDPGIDFGWNDLPEEYDVNEDALQFTARGQIAFQERQARLKKASQAANSRRMEESSWRELGPGGSMELR
ncbi:hypothetical protein BT69DRAFT_1353817 [Atractiella rhizophila]|nr:hypothetical protein BT69DRAFT_1353817 [Atractiella rhizophila]